MPPRFGGSLTAALSVTDAARRRLWGPVDFAMSAPAVAAVLERVCAVLPAAAVKVGIEAAGHYHRPLLVLGVWPAGWEVLEQAASAEPAPTASTAIPPACRTERRETALAMSPKYSLSLVLGTGFEHASPHL